MSLLQGLFQGLIVFIQVDTGVSGALAAESCPPEGGIPPAPTSPRCTHLQDQRWALASRKFASDPFILYSLFYRILLQEPHPQRFSFRGQSLLCKARMSDSHAQERLRTPGVDKLC